MQTPVERACCIFRTHHGTLRTAEAMRAGIHPRTLYLMRDSGTIEQISRGLFRLAELPPPGEPDLFTVARRVPRAVFCLLTAAAFHQMSTQIPHSVEIALPRSARVPRLSHPPLKVFRFSPASLDAGIEIHTLDGVPVQVYCREKTLVDIFKYRTEVGLDIAIEALRTYRSQPKPNFPTVLEYARVCRVERVIRPYLESLL